MKGQGAPRTQPSNTTVTYDKCQVQPSVRFAFFQFSGHLYTITSHSIRPNVQLLVLYLWLISQLHSSCALRHADVVKAASWMRASECERMRTEVTLKAANTVACLTVSNITIFRSCKETKISNGQHVHGEKAPLSQGSSVSQTSQALLNDCINSSNNCYESQSQNDFIPRCENSSEDSTRPTLEQDMHTEIYPLATL